MQFITAFCGDRTSDVMLHSPRLILQFFQIHTGQN